ncbi:PepSY domain-containing protein [Anthocerotibacter panamensis]|uniref:PepSY domain-containing protein n=1 Tax=Anthocerotibacter panamensis TaxID=2857077 RepID=UPI001C405530|nr:PepSY domain-containing protein [Anthocerotibacter panamensis]
MFRTHWLYALLVGSLAIFPGVVSAAPYRSSIQVPYQKVSEHKEEINTPRLKKLARLSYADAIAIARKKYRGKLGQVDLENEDGNLIYSVELGKRELAIDAGSGKILQVE